MKSFVAPMILFLFGGLAVFAQNVPPVGTTVNQRVPGSPAVPNIHGLSASGPLQPTGGATGTGPAANIADVARLLTTVRIPITNANGAQLSLAEISGTLLALQRGIEQTLPLLDRLNDSLFAAGVGGPAPSTGTIGSPAPPAVAPPPLAGNASRGSALTTGGAPITSTPTTGATVPDEFLPTLQALNALQSDLERLLPLVAVLNGAPLTPPNTNTTTTVPGTSLAPGETALSPTGR